MNLPVAPARGGIELINALRDFLRTEAASGLLLLIAMALAMAFG